MKSLYESLLDDEDEVVDKLNTKLLIKEWLKKYSIKNYKINEDNTIDIKGDVLLPQHPESELPSYIQFRNITDSFSINGSKLETLRGCPKDVGGNFSCSRCNSLKTLEGAPKKVGRNFDCSGCPSLKTLEGAPKEVGGAFHCRYCENLISLEGAPKKVGRNFNCEHCENLISLEGAPKKVGGDMYCSYCKNLNITTTDIKKYTK